MNIILSIKPKWAELIYSGKKTIEWRKSWPKYNMFEFQRVERVFLYETAPVKKITGFFILNDPPVFLVSNLDSPNNQCLLEMGCVQKEDLKKYKGNNDVLFGWMIGKVTRFPEPWGLEMVNLKRPPQSWCYDYSDLPF
jgi:predicted transcriptional regulator